MAKLMLKTGRWLTMLAATMSIGVQNVRAQVKIIDPGIDLTTDGRTLGVLVSGCNLTASSANTLGGWPHFSVGVSGTLSHPSFRVGSVSSGSLAAILRVGVLEGVDLGPSVHGLGSMDLYLRLGTLITNGRESANVNIWGLGTRIGILRNSILSPAVSISAGYHRTGSFSLAKVIHGTHPGPQDADISTWSLRCELSKNLFLLTPVAGVGLNRNRIKSTRTGIPTGSGPSGLNPNINYFDPQGFEVTRKDLIYYAGVEWNFFLMRVGLELGRTGGETFGGLGLRFAI